MTGSERGPRTAHSRSTTWAVIVVGVVAAFQAGKAAIATPDLQTDLGIDLAAVGALSSVIAVAGLVASLFAGAAVGAFGDRKLLIVGAAAILSGALAGAVAPTFALLLTSRLLEGLGFVLVLVAGPAVLNRTTAPDRRDRALALWSCVMPAGIALAMVAGSLIHGWRPLWWASVALAAFAGLAAITIERSDRGPSTAGRDVLRMAGNLLGHRGPLLLALIFALYTLSFFALFSFLPVLLAEGLGWSYLAAGLISAFASLANVAGNLAAGRFLSRGANPTVLLISSSAVMGLCGAGLFLPILPDSARVAAAIVFSAIGGMTPATLMSAAPRLATADKAPAMFGLLMAGSNAGQVLGPVAVGAWVQVQGWSAGAAAVGLAALIAMLAALAARRTLSGQGRPASGDGSGQAAAEV